MICRPPPPRDYQAEYEAALRAFAAKRRREVIDCATRSYLASRPGMKATDLLVDVQYHAGKIRHFWHMIVDRMGQFA